MRKTILLAIPAVLLGCSSTPTAEGPKDANGSPAPVSTDPQVTGNVGSETPPPSGPNGEGLGQESPADSK